MKTVIIVLTLLFILLLWQAPAGSAQAQEASAASYDDYAVIYERNIFSKDRRPPREETARQVRTTQVLSIYVLRGTAVGGGERVAFIEEQVLGETIRAGIGTDVLDGIIRDITYDRVMFEQNGQVRSVRVGEEFGKTESTVMTTVSADTPQDVPAETPAESAPAGGGDGSDILQRLMERRQSELGQ